MCLYLYIYGVQLCLLIYHSLLESATEGSNQVSQVTPEGGPAPGRIVLDMSWFVCYSQVVSWGYIYFCMCVCVHPQVFLGKCQDLMQSCAPYVYRRYLFNMI